MTKSGLQLLLVTSVKFSIIVYSKCGSTHTDAIGGVTIEKHIIVSSVCNSDGVIWLDTDDT
jgi:hypothetical protein